MYIFLYVVISLLALILLLTLLAPKEYDVSRSIFINKPKAEVFNVLRSLKEQDTWSPWAKKDPGMHKEYRGVDGEVGSVSYWNGNKEVGEGEQEITSIKDGERIEGHLRFLKPFKSESNCYFITESVNQGTKVTWGFNGKNKFPMRIMMLFMSMDKMVGKDFEEGLASLKSKMES
ncbi:SRPBCC family protein [Flavobacterium sp. ASW18X]|uniref:SRPBCC family protein n=1 Tax=Flavobacterium sp. ASW18X TaxID=2572595 RepID=UPI0010ADEEA3|nr:SRPBCC family protein [Flavobacterium sp. ASW18X]TKD60712.1 polyketide cyclase [Flavobacterium sp. ASW18X]